MLVPWCTSTGALIGAVAGAVMSGWVSFGSQWASATGQVISVQLPLSTSECLSNVTVRNTSPPIYQDQVFPLYRLSYHWITPIGVVSVIIVGMVASLFTEKPRDKVDSILLSPAIRWLVNRNEPKKTNGSFTVEVNTRETMLVD